MNRNIIEKLIPDVHTDFEHNALNVYVSYENIDKLTERLRDCDKALIDAVLWQEKIGYTEDQVKDICGDFIIVIEKATVKSWKEIKELL